MAQLANISIIFQDSVLLAVNKPAGISTLPDGYDPALPHVKSILEPQYGRLWIVHRLDKQTSGVLLLARSAQSHRSLNTQFEQRQASKVYHALVLGNPGWKESTVDLPLRANGDRQHRTIVDPMKGKPAVTHLRVIERMGDCCLLQAIPETGRTHQIRAHLYSLGLSILGDTLYGQKPPARDKGFAPSTTQPICAGFPELAMGLHARTLEITHPTTDERMKFTAPYPDYWLEVLHRLRSAGAGSIPADILRR